MKLANKNILIYSHDDLDGFGSNIIAKTLKEIEKSINVRVVNCGYKTIDKTVEQDFLNGEWLNYDLVFITDISVKDELAKMINSEINSNELYKDKVIRLLDHHDSALGLNKYKGFLVTSSLSFEENEIDLESMMAFSLMNQFNENINKDRIEKEYKGLYKVCGSDLFLYTILDIFKEDNLHEKKEVKNLMLLVEAIRQYDTWQWKEVTGETLPKDINTLFWNLDNKNGEFVNVCMQYISNKDNDMSLPKSEFLPNFFEKIDSKYKLIVESINQEISEYISRKNNEMIVLDDFMGHKNVGVIYASKHISELGNVICEMNRYISFVIIINEKGEKCSLRTISEVVNLSKLAKDLGGGGHPKASGIPYNEKNKQYIHDLINNKNRQELKKLGLLDRIKWFFKK